MAKKIFKGFALCEPGWAKCHRLVPSHFPPIELFENIADPEDLDILYALEAMTNDRLLDQVGDLALVAAEDRVTGNGSSPLMAPFTHIGYPSRFTDGSYGVYYAANTLNTAIKETCYHREQFMAATQEPDTELTMRQYINKVQLPVLDIRSGKQKAALLDKDDYTAAQAFATQARAAGINGICYPSVRDSQGECVAAFRPPVMTIPRQGKHFRYVWSGQQQRIISVLQVAHFELHNSPRSGLPTYN